MKTATKKSDVTSGRHYAIIKYENVAVDTGYADHPGSDSIARHYVTTDKTEWESEIRRLTLTEPTYGLRKPEFVAFEVNGLAQISVNVSVAVS